MTIRAQILLAVAFISGLTIAGFALVVTQRVQARANQLAHEAAVENARFVSLIATRGLDKTGASFDTAAKRLQETGWLIRLGGNGAATRLQLFDVHGKVRFDSARADQTSAGGPDVEAALRGEPLTSPHLLPGSRVAAAEPLRRGDGGEVLGAVRVMRPVLGVEEILRTLAPEIGALAAGSMLLAVLLAFLLGGSISAPIRSLTAAARRIADGDRALPLPAARGAEVRALTAAYADMRRALEDKRQIERLSQDLSHELKNPIAAVRSLAEALEAGAIADGSAGPRMVEQIKAASMRMEGILRDMLALARLEARGLDPKVPVDFLTLVEDARAGLSARSAERAVVVEIGKGPLPAVQADKAWLTRAIGNLLSNAIENSAAGGRVRAVAEVRDGQLELRVSNSGEVPAAIRDRLFERFVTRRPEGSGLGLAIVRSVAEAHDGSATLLEAGPPQVVMQLRLPHL